MKGIYLTEEGKQEIENKIAKLEQEIEEAVSLNHRIKAFDKINEIAVYNKILSYSTILPIEEDWYHVHFVLDEVGEQLNKEYPNGVIINLPKKVVKEEEEEESMAIKLIKMGLF